MSLHPYRLLRQWAPLRDQQQWVLGTVFRTTGSAYRKAGAMMLFSDMGQQLGLLSGGCLESDLHRQAMKLMGSEGSRRLSYDSGDEGDVAYLLGIGCGGLVEVLLQPLHRDNHYLQLPTLLDHLDARRPTLLCQQIPDDGSPGATRVVVEGQEDPSFESAITDKAQLREMAGQSWLLTPHHPVPHLGVFGGGVDAQPLVAQAKSLGWQITLIDPRPSHGRAPAFPDTQVVRRRPSELDGHPWLKQLDAVVIMTHNLELDSEALNLCADLPLKYAALLGPSHRRREALELAGFPLSPHQPQWPGQPPLAGPAGLRLGAELPEGIALSILAECYAALHGGDGHSISGTLASVSP